MTKLGKELIIKVILSSLLFTNLLIVSYAYALRVPVGDVGRLKNILVLPNTNTPFSIQELTEIDEIKDCLDKWFGQNIARNFKRNLWDIVALHYPGSIMRIITSDGQILGIAYIHKEKTPFWYSYDIKTWKQNMIPVYEVDLCEISSDSRRKGLGKLLMAEIAGKILTDTETKKKIILIRPRDNEDIHKFYKKLGATPIHIHFGDIDNSRMFFYFIFKEKTCRSLVEDAYRRFTPKSLRARKLKKVIQLTGVINFYKNFP